MMSSNFELVFDQFGWSVSEWKLTGPTTDLSCAALCHDVTVPVSEWPSSITSLQCECSFSEVIGCWFLRLAARSPASGGNLNSSSLFIYTVLWVCLLSYRWCCRCQHFSWAFLLLWNRGHIFLVQDKRKRHSFTFKGPGSLQQRFFLWPKQMHWSVCHVQPAGRGFLNNMNS